MKNKRSIKNIDEKRFDEWIKLKKKLHFSGSLPRVSEGDVWWCSCGENVGVEINGKSQLFSRPVFVLKKLSRFGFIGIPLTSQKKTGSWYVKIDFQERDEFVALCQIRVFSVSRLSNRMGRLDKKDSRKIRDGLRKFLG